MKIDNSPLVTVIVPSYNHEKYICETINSIINQTYKNIELIVVDDGSKDNSPKILKKLSDKYGFKFIIQENKGLAQTLTDTTKKYANGKYIANCASDDYWIEDKIELQVKFLEENSEFAMCFGNTYEIDSESKIINNSLNRGYKGGYIFKEIITQKFHPPVNHMIKKSILEEFEYYKGGIIAEDFYMNCLISYKYKIGFINDIIGYYRRSAVTKRDPLRLLECHRQTIDLFKDHPIYNEAVSYSNLRMAYFLSLYIKYKLLSIKYIIRSMNKSLNDKWIKSIYHLFFNWKKF